MGSFIFEKTISMRDDQHERCDKDNCEIEKY